MIAPAWSVHCGDRWRAHVLGAIGTDICDIVGPSPRRPRDWAAMMRRLGVRDMAGVITSVHGGAIPYRQAMRGDVVQRGWAIGICRGDKAEFFGGEFVPMREVDGAWRLQAARDRRADPLAAHAAKLDPRRLVRDDQQVGGDLAEKREL
ncbi:DUF6950 family protein [Sphingomonas aquatilis]